MTPIWTGSAFVTVCPRCKARISSQTKAVAQQRATEHEAECGPRG